MYAFSPIPALGYDWVKISTHGLLIAIGFVVAGMLARREAKKRGLSVDFADNAIIVAVTAGLVGARLIYILSFGQGMGFIEMLKVWHGGLSSHGGYIFGIAAGLGYLRYKSADLRAYADALFPYLLVGWAIGRIGCFLNWDSFGSITDSWLSVAVYGEARYPTQLFESFGYLLSFSLCSIFSRSRKDGMGRRKGDLAVFALFLFALTRFIVDFYRGDPPQYLLLSRIVTAAVLVICAMFLVFPFRLKKKNVIQ
jgi:phosphatidylglycerol---prolipoprotein diacylglyceryl transferase